jgi:hypothetical protein
MPLHSDYHFLVPTTIFFEVEVDFLSTDVQYIDKNDLITLA